jgi:hypothetical protein
MEREKVDGAAGETATERSAKASSTGEGGEDGSFEGESFEEDGAEGEGRRRTTRRRATWARTGNRGLRDGATRGQGSQKRCKKVEANR